MAAILRLKIFKCGFLYEVDTPAFEIRPPALWSFSDEAITDIQRHTADGKKYSPEFEIIVEDEDKNIVARVKKGLYVKKKPGR